MIGLIAFIILIHLFLLTKLIFYPYPELFIYPYLANNGLLPYKQILDQHFPGLLFLPINLNNLGMVNEVIARHWLMGVVLVVQILIYFITKKLFNQKTALLANLLFLIWQPFLEGWVLWIDSFMPLFLLPAFYFVTKKRLFLGGLFLGGAVLFKQTAIPLVCMVSLYLIWELRSIKKLIPFIAGFLPVPILMVIYYWVLGVFQDFWYWTVTFNLTTYATGGTKTHEYKQLIRVLGMATPLIFIIKTGVNKNLVLLGVFILGSLVGVFDRPDFVHFQPALPFIVIGISWVFMKIFDTKWGKVVIGLYILLIIWWLRIFFLGHISNHVISFEPQTKQISQKIRTFVNPREEIFVFGAQPHLYQMSDTIPAGGIFVFQFPWFLEETQDRILASLENSQPKLIVRDSTMTTDGQSIRDYGQPINAYIDENYQLADRIGDVEFLLKNAKDEQISR